MKLSGQKSWNKFLRESKTFLELKWDTVIKGKMR